MAYLKICNIEKSFGKFKVLKNINLELEKGEFICFLGPSGCGKTTLLRIISGLEKADSGKIFLGEKDITDLQPSKRKLSMVFQTYALFPNMTVFQNIEYGIKNKISNKDERKEKIEKVLDLVDLLHIKKKYPLEMSEGQQQRISLARALAMEPSILLLDEPLSALDAKVREKLRMEIKSIHDKLGITTIMVTHDQEEALTMGDRIVVMNEGKIVQVGYPEEIYNEPKDIFVADFIGKVNLIKDKKGKIHAIRPEQIEYSITPKENSIETILENIEFRGAFYRLTLRHEMELIYLDMLAKEKNKLGIKKNIKIYIKLV
ncbi:MAG: ABC transporter ATP-binding protein [Fusobacteriaceae bacterium]